LVETKSLRFDQLRDEFAKATIEMDNFKSYKKLQELRHITNCVKHGKGDDRDSCAKLRELRPDLFQFIDSFSASLPSHETYELFKRNRAVRQPLVGEDLYISANQFASYASEVDSFWDELVEILERH